MPGYRKLFWHLLFCRMLLGMLLAIPLGAQGNPVVSAELRGSISPAAAAYFKRALATSLELGAELCVVSIDTPGGLDTAMREMIQAMLGSKVPVALFVSPRGSRAASAGTYLLFASHVAAMAPGTNLGAASPVSIGMPTGLSSPKGDDQAKTVRNKAMQDASAYLRSLAQLRERNADWAEKAVTEAASLTAEEALKLGVIDLVAEDITDLLRQLEGRRVSDVQGELHVLALTDATVIALERNWQESLLGTLADPNIALILLMLGIYGLLFEFYTPGLSGPGVIGAICLLLALYGLALWPINYVGLALILLGVALMVAELFVPSFGVLGIGGLTAFIAGSLMLMDMSMPGLTLAWHLLMPFMLMSAAVFGSLGWLALRARKRPPVSGNQGMLGSKVEALEDIPAGGKGWVLVGGERWQAQSAEWLKQGDAGVISGIDGLTLHIRPMAHAYGFPQKNEGERP